MNLAILHAISHRDHEIGRVATALDRNALSLRFVDQKVEREFQADAGDRFRSQVVATLALGMATWAATGILLSILFPVDVPRVAVAIGAVETFILSLAVVLRHTRSWDGIQTISALVNLGGGFAIIAIGGFVVEMPHLIAPALLVGLTFAFGLSRFGPIGVAVTAPYVTAFVALVATGNLASNGPFEIFLVVIGYGVASIGGYMLEANTRDVFRARRIIAMQREALAEEKEKSERLLRNMLPAHIVDRLRERPQALADRLPDVSVLFADLVGFTRMAGKLPPDQLVETLDELFSRFDALAERHGLEKIKTIGDAYMAVAGATANFEDHARRAVEMGLDMLAEVDRFFAGRPTGLQLRVGINTGPVVAGVIGRSRFSYDLWGDTVNVASRMESQGVAGAIQVSGATAQRLVESYRLEPVGVIDVRGKGPMATFLVRPQPAVRRPEAEPESVGKAA